VEEQPRAETRSRSGSKKYRRGGRSRGAAEQGDAVASVRRSAGSEPGGGRRRVVVGGVVVVLVIVVAGGRRGALRGHDLRQPSRRGPRGNVLRAARSGDAGGRGGGGGGRGAVVRRGGAAGRGGARAAAAAALPPVDGAPRPQTVHGAARRRDQAAREMARRGRAGEWEGSGGRARSRRRWSFQFFFFSVCALVPRILQFY
jgi:hypothetical protein